MKTNHSLIPLACLALAACQTSKIEIPEVEGEKDSFGTDEDDGFNVEDYIND